ncbi:MAG: AAA family ATPase [Planctomycetes bacterium]|nr:AAA family ATPase [Planctomycetota bacterium]
MQGPPPVELLDVHGLGNTSRVWRARMGADWGPFAAGADVAIKILRPELARDPDALGTLQREARVSADFAHDAVARTYWLEETSPAPRLRGGSTAPADAASDPGADRAWLLQDFIPGTSLAEELDSTGALPEPTVRAIGARLATALAELHAAGWVHGDVKPDNVRLDRGGRASLVDLGHAEAEGSAGGALGTPRFLSPERASGAPASGAADTFALGALLFEIAVGAPACGVPPDLRRLRSGGVHPPSNLVPRLSPLLDAIVLAALAPDPAERPSCSTVSEVLALGASSPWWRARLSEGAAERARGTPWTGRHDLPLVGRADELARLVGAWDAASEGGAVALLRGDRGMGKSRLVTEFVHRIRGRSESPPIYIYGRCERVTEERPGATLLTLVRRWLHLPHDVAPGERSRALIEGAVPPPIARTLINALDPGPKAPEDQEVTEAAALGEWMLALGRSRPTIIFLDDINFAGTTTLDALVRVARGLPETRLLLVLGERQRAGFRKAAGLAELRRRVQPFTVSIPLGPISEEAVLKVVEQTFHHSVPRLRLARVLHERTGGVPGSVEEVLRLMEERGWARPMAGQGQGLELLISPDELPRPKGVLEAVDERLATLDGRARIWLERLAIVGSRFEAAVVANAWDGVPVGTREAAFSHLVRTEWIVPSGSRYRFAEPIERDEILAKMSARRRRRGHLAVARALRELETRRGRRPSFRRAFHLREGEALEELLSILPGMLRRLASAGHPHRLATLAGWGLEALDAGDGLEGPRALFLEALAGAADRLGERAEQRAALEGLAELDLDLERRPAEGARVYLLHARFSIGGGEFGLARGLLRNAEGLADRAAREGPGPGRGQDQLELDRAEIARLSGRIALELGDLDEARSRAKEAADLAPDPVAGAQANILDALILIYGGDPEAALLTLTQLRRSLRRNERSLGATAARAESSLVAGRAWRLIGRLRLADRAFERAGELALRGGEGRIEVEVAARHGRLLADVGREREAELMLRDALFAARRTEDRRGEATASLFLGILIAEQGLPGARDLVRRSHRLSTALGLQRHLALTIAVEARLAREAGERAEALRGALQAQRLTEEHGAELPDQIVVSATLSLALAESGRTKLAIQVRRGIERQILADNDRLGSRLKRRRHLRWTRALLESALSADGPLYPRGVLGS